jgi:AbrB family looped-hinge helix DNA binding protein
VSAAVLELHLSGEPDRQTIHKLIHGDLALNRRLLPTPPFTSSIGSHLVDSVRIMYIAIMRTKVTTRGQVSVPSEVRKALNIGPNTTLEWIIEANSVRVVPIPEDPIAAFRGSGPRGQVQRLMKERGKDRLRENGR